MNLKYNINYFKKSDLPKFLGICMLAIGFICLWLGHGYFSWIIMSVFLPVGLVLFIYGSSGKASDADIDGCIEMKSMDMEVDLSSDIHYNRRILKGVEPIVAEGYEYRPGLMLTKAKNGSLRSSEYRRTIVYILSDSLYITTRLISLVTEDVTNEIVEIPYTDIEKVQLKTEESTLTFGKNSFRAKITVMSVERKNGETFECPISDDITSENEVAKLNGVISEYKKTL